MNNSNCSVWSDQAPEKSVHEMPANFEQMIKTMPTALCLVHGQRNAPAAYARGCVACGRTEGLVKMGGASLKPRGECFGWRLECSGVRKDRGIVCQFRSTDAIDASDGKGRRKGLGSQSGKCWLSPSRTKWRLPFQAKQQVVDASLQPQCTVVTLHILVRTLFSSNLQFEITSFHCTSVAAPNTGRIGALLCPIG